MLTLFSWLVVVIKHDKGPRNIFANFWCQYFGQ